MTHDQIVAALQGGYQLDDARDSRRGCYPIRKPTPRTTVRRTWNDPPPPGISDPTGFGEGCVI
jgi:hypothetical protein